MKAVVELGDKLGLVPVGWIVSHASSLELEEAGIFHCLEERYHRLDYNTKHTRIIYICIIMCIYIIVIRDRLLEIYFTIQYIFYGNI